MIDLDKLCKSCFARKAPEGACPECGYTEGEQPESAIYLPCGTILNGKYIVGRMMHSTNNYAAYLGYNINMQSKVCITEFLPKSMVLRTASSPMLTIPDESQSEKFREKLSTFKNQAEQLLRFQNLSIVAALQYFEENNTGYLVTDYVSGETLSEELKSKRYTCSEALSIILPILGGLSALHSVGALHLHISPDNIVIQRSGLPVLIGIGMPEAVTEPTDSEIASTSLAQGYAPIEQYQSDGKTGPYTDIYSIAAVFYHMITGKAPQEATERAEKDALEPLGKLADGVPKKVEAVIMKALRLKSKSRYSSAAELRYDLLAASGGKQILRQEQKLLATPQEKKKKLVKIIALGSAGAVLVAMILCFIFIGIPMIKYNTAVNDLSSGNYNEAIAVFSDLGNYKDAHGKITEAKFAKAYALYDNKQYDDAIALCDELAASEIPGEQKNEAFYLKANALFNNGEYIDARAIFKQLGRYGGSPDMVLKCTYQNAQKWEAAGEFSTAYHEYISLGDYEDAVSRSESCCLAQMEKELKDESSDNAWLELCLKNKNIKDQALQSAGSILKEKITAGSDDFVYSLLTGSLNSYPDKLTEQGYLLAVSLMNKKKYEDSKVLLEWISDTNYKDSAELLSECNYQLLLMKVAKDPHAEDSIVELYNYAKINYKDSREMLDAICTPDILFSYLDCGPTNFTQVDRKTWTYYWGGVAFYEYKYKLSIPVFVRAPIPIQGKLILKFKAPISENYWTDDTVTKEFTVELVIKPGKYSYTMNYTTDWLREYPNVTEFRSAIGKNELRVYYGD